MGPRLVVSEFPNDNPELHDGLVWACPTPCAPALPTLRLRPRASVRVLRPEWELQSDARACAEPPDGNAELVTAEPTVTERALAEPAIAEPAIAEPAVAEPAIAEPAIAELVVESAVVEAVVAESTPSEPPAAEISMSGFEAFIAALSGILAERGATRAAANVGALLGRARLARDAFDAATRKALVGRGFLDAKTGRPMPEFTVVAHAWRDVLEGTGADLASCGSATLDVFGADLLAALLGLPRERTDELRRALRQRGVAAFGMLAAA